MDGFQCIDLSKIPYDYERFYATNHPFQRAGPKGFIQVKILENDDLYVRVDLPGVPDDAIRHRVDSVRQKVVLFSGETIGDDMEDSREYSGTAGLGCDCCEITGVDAKMKDGVLRMILSRVKVKDHENKCTLTLPPFTGKSGDRALGEEDHPFVVKGRKNVKHGGKTDDGSFYFTVDVPGVCSDDILVLPNENEVKFYAENKIVFEHDESGRIFMGAVPNSFCGGTSEPVFLSYNITWDAEFGVLKLLFTPPPPPDHNNNDG